MTCVDRVGVAMATQFLDGTEKSPQNYSSIERFLSSPVIISSFVSYTFFAVRRAFNTGVMDSTIDGFDILAFYG